MAAKVSVTQSAMIACADPCALKTLTVVLLYTATKCIDISKLPEKEG